MKKPNQLLRASGVGQANLKYNAHALTLFAVFWSLPSGVVVMMIVLGAQDRLNAGGALSWPSTPGGIAGACAVLAVPVIHLWSIIAAIYYWCTERKRRVTVLHTGGDVFAD